MGLAKFLALFAVVLPLACGAPTQSASGLDPRILEAMKRDLGLDAEQATARVARDEQAPSIIEQVRGAVGDAFAGAWIDGDVLHVAVTDQALAGAVRAAGAAPMIVTNSLSKLEKAKADLDAVFAGQANTERSASASSAASEGIAALHVDVASNRLVIEALPDHHDQAAALAGRVGLSASEFEVRTVAQMPGPMAAIEGGDAFLINNLHVCSVGFAVTTGFVSAGHCGPAGSPVTTTNGEALGTMVSSEYPGRDMSHVRTVSGTVLWGWVNRYGERSLPVAGSAEAAVGASVCRSGLKTHVRCGTITSRAVTVIYPDGPIYGLTKTDACAESGDSGGSFYAGGQAQGVTSGGVGDCTNGATIYFQPLNEILEVYNLTLVKGM